MKFGFLGEKRCRNRNSKGKLARSSLLAKSSVTISLIARFSPLAKLHSDTIPYFMFLRLFHTFLFWIGLWCKHESFR